MFNFINKTKACQVREIICLKASTSLSLFLFFFLWTVNCFGGGGPENVFLLVNSAIRDSLTVANHYTELRNIPPSNVFCIDYRGSYAFATGQKFRENILFPALVEIKRRGLSDQIDYLVYSCNFPWRIDLAEDFPEVNFPKQARPMASLTGATYLASFSVHKRKEIVNLNANFYAQPATAVATISQGFRAKYRWAPRGKKISNGISYYLSAILGVTNGRGNSVDEIVSYLKRSAVVDGTQPKGTIYFVKNKDVRSWTRHDGFDNAIREIRLAGVKAELVQGKFLQRKLQVMGVTCGGAQLNVRSSGTRFLPGAFSDNFTSSGGKFTHSKKPPGQTCVSEFLRAGAAGANGTVIEPFAIPQKFPNAGLHVHYVHGCSLAESFYQSVNCPYQQILVGEPLCQPWAIVPEVTVSGITRGDTIQGLVTITPAVKTKSTKGIKSLEFYVDGKRMQQGKVGDKFTLDTSTLDDGQHELRVVAIDGSLIETQGRWVGNVIVKNGMDAVQLSVKKSSIKKGMKILVVRVVSTRDEPVALYHHSRELGRVTGGTGSLKIRTAELGSGPITLFGITEGKNPVRSPNLKINLPKHEP
ncbi:MAG TPA: hypothetical protein DHW22_09075 [Planctomycetaceae bacterium]|nr:hypothetical protein [Planctomycetaceae bacterium]